MEFVNVSAQKSFMHREAKRLNFRGNYNYLYRMFYIRLFLEKLCSINDDFLIKGGFSQFAHFGRLIRPFSDADLIVCDGKDMTLNKLLELVEKVNDDLKCTKYILNSDPTRTPNNTWQISLSAVSEYPNGSKLISCVPIDFLENTIKPIKSQHITVAPLFQGDNPFTATVPEIEDIIAEKLYLICRESLAKQAFVRVKDFYDLFMLYTLCLDKDKISLYFQIKTIMRSGENSLEKVNSEFLNSGFINSNRRIWDSLVQKYCISEPEEWDKFVLFAKNVLDEQIEIINLGTFNREATDYARERKKNNSKF